MMTRSLTLLMVLTLAVGMAPQSVEAQDYDMVILNGRVMDPETSFDAVRNVGALAPEASPEAVVSPE